MSWLGFIRKLLGKTDIFLELMDRWHRLNDDYNSLPQQERDRFVDYIEATIEHDKRVLYGKARTP